MKQSVSTITLHGVLGEAVGKSVWKLAINSVSEAVHAIEMQSKRRLYRFLYDNDKKGVKYKVIVNGKEFTPPEDLTVENPERLKNNELTIKRKIDTIDIVPVIQGAGDNGLAIMNIILGVIIIIIGIVLSFIPYVGPALGVPIIIAGLGLLASGIIGLLSEPPKNEKFQEVEKGGAVSYLFNGPENTINEGGPVPVVYGRLIVGSQAIAATYNVEYKDASVSALTQ